MLYGRHGVAEIAAARADIGNLTCTTEALLSAIEDARRTHQHLVLFVTGIPGAGKTLCGLNAVFGTDSGAAFLTGNLPLVHVMREALARDARDQGRSLRQARQETESALQPLIGFLRDNLSRSSPPHEHVIVFDEAQRAWDASFGRRKFGHAESEAALFLDIMHRHNDWAVIVALVGGGQEINTGEAGLAEWGRVGTPRLAYPRRSRRAEYRRCSPASFHDRSRHFGDRSGAPSGCAGQIDPLRCDRTVGRCSARRRRRSGRRYRRGRHTGEAHALAGCAAYGAAPEGTRYATLRAGVQRRCEAADR
jgi:hypothetical protein